ncbi:DNA gyrase subunit B [Zavarzinella formosa]|uniref:DNA gyrase subunit B n=1 Tax=Zavarzinella formosa TaxID=360055 RepID=UPI000319F55E|nr:DNA gyrase subunit B [Zavarzinella formosa]
MSTDLVSADVAVAVGDSDYTAKNTQVLRNRDHIRKRPDNYIPDTGTRGLHHLVYELVYNAVDEHLAGHCKTIQVSIHVDGSLSVSDDGRGIPVDMHPTEHKSNLEVVMTIVGAGGKFDNAAYKSSAGLHGMGSKAVTALSELTRAEVRRNGRVYMMEFDRGVISGALKEIGPADRTGTKITFWPDVEIFNDATFEFDTLENRLRELAFLNRGLSITIKDERTDKETHFIYEGGVSEYVAWLNRNEQVLHPPIYILKTVDWTDGDGNNDPIKVEVALQYSTGDEERVRCYANNQYNPNGGTHQTGFRRALTRVVNAYAEKEKLYKDDTKPEGKDFSEGLTAVVNVTLSKPHFEAQTKIRLNNPEVDGAVNNAVSEVLAKYLEENPKESKLIIQKVSLSAEMREAQAKLRKSMIDRKKIIGGGGLPGKLMDCTTRDREISELFLVEGDSAGGSAESGRDRHYQAVLPLRGKVLNVEKARLEKLLQNKEIASLIGAIGVDIGNPEDISKLRYGKIVILTDADVDGQHIRTLLLTFFFRQMRKLIEDGHLYVARPPLFKVTQKKNVRFVQTNEEMFTELNKRGLNGSRLETLVGNFEGDSLATLLETMDRLESSLAILERRGVSLTHFVSFANAAGDLPTWHVRLESKESWFFTSEEVNAFRMTESTRLGRDLMVEDTEEEVAGALSQFVADEYHEVRAINRALAKLRDLGFTVADLIPAPRIAGREPPIRYTMVHDDTRHTLISLRDVVSEIRHFGEKGLTITRFKGLGEMDPDELWATTLDPKVRQLLKVTLVDALTANDLFRTLMGEEVEDRRNFIFDKGINVKDAIDYGA